MAAVEDDNNDDDDDDDNDDDDKDDDNNDDDNNDKDNDGHGNMTRMTMAQQSAINHVMVMITYGAAAFMGFKDTVPPLHR